jgi:hypothetical protein
VNVIIIIREMIVVIVKVDGQEKIVKHQFVSVNQQVIVILVQEMVNVSIQEIVNVKQDGLEISAKSHYVMEKLIAMVMFVQVMELVKILIIANVIQIGQERNVIFQHVPIFQQHKVVYALATEVVMMLILVIVIVIGQVIIAKYQFALVNQYSAVVTHVQGMEIVKDPINVVVIQDGQEKVVKNHYVMELKIVIKMFAQVVENVHQLIPVNVMMAMEVTCVKYQNALV